MEAEIIKTDDPNLVEEVTTVTRTINVQMLVDRKTFLELNSSEFQECIDQLRGATGLSPIVQAFIDEKINELEIRISTNDIELSDLNDRINGINKL